MIQRRVGKGLAISFTLMIGTTAWAGDGGYVGALLGVDLPTSSGRKSGTLYYGARAGGIVHQSENEKLVLGGVFLRGSTSDKVSSATIDQSINIIGAELLGFELWGTPLYMGGRIGLGLLSVDASTPTASLSMSGTSLVVSPVVGVEIPVGNVGLDIEGSYYTRTGGTLTGTLGSMEYNSASGFLLSGGLRVKF